MNNKDIPIKGPMASVVVLIYLCSYFCSCLIANSFTSIHTAGNFFFFFNNCIYHTKGHIDLVVSQRVSQVAQCVKNLPPMQKMRETWV